MRKMDRAKKYSYVQPTVFIKQLSNVDMAMVQDYLVDFKGFTIEARTTRSYSSSVLANALGYVSEITKKQLENDTINYYQQGDYIGQSGIECLLRRIFAG